MQIWHEGTMNIGHAIDSVLNGASVMILKNDGTVMQAGYAGNDGRGGGVDLVSGATNVFRRFSVFDDGSVRAIHQVL